MEAEQWLMLREALLGAQAAVNRALAVLAVEAPSGNAAILLPGGGVACQHPRRVNAMGGYWSCPECGAQGREEAT